MTRRALGMISALALAAAGCGSPAAAPFAAPQKPVATAPAPPPAPAGAVQATPATVVTPAKPGTPAAAVPGTPAPATPATATTTATPAAPLVPPSPPVPETKAPGYDSKGRRDPFVEIDTISGGSGLLVSTTKLTGIVRSARSTLALVETPEGIGYILKPGDTLGDGRLLEIGVDSVVFAITPRPGFSSNRVVLRLAAN